LRAEWVIASTEASDRLVIPSDRPRLDRRQWRAKPLLALEFEPVLGRIESLATGGLTSMHVVGDFLQRWIASLQARACLSCWFTGSNDLGRVHRGPGTDLSWEELELLVKITGESFVVESLIPPEGISSLCDNQGLRSAILDWLPTLDESGIAVRQTGGRDPHRGIQIPGVPAEGSRPTDASSRAPPRLSAPRGRAREPRAVLPPRVVPGGRRERGGTACVVPTGLSSRIRPLIRASLRSARGQLVGSGRPAPRVRRGALVLHQHHHQLRHHRRHHHLACHCHTGSNINNSNSSRGSGRLASKVVGKSRALSKCTPFRFPHWSSYHVDEC
jgi:hypothetical protein